MKVSIFRIEKPGGGAGPYADTSGHPMLAHMNAVHGDAEHPDPMDDPLLDGIYPDEHCGFATICDLDAWFTGYAEALAECGYVIAVYTVPLTAVRYGQKQAVFLRGDAVPMRTFPIAEAPVETAMPCRL